MARTCRNVAAVIGLALIGACSRAEVASKGPDQAASETAFPSGYRSWKRLNPQPILREADRVARDLFANEVALHRDAAGRFPVGSVLVKEERELTESPGGQLVPRDVVRVAVMFKVGKGEMEGWSFKAYDPATGREFPKDRVDPDGCYFCHSDARERDFVFSDVR